MRLISTMPRKTACRILLTVGFFAILRLRLPARSRTNVYGKMATIFMA
jgi:hypothetical protein